VAARCIRAASKQGPDAFAAVAVPRQDRAAWADMVARWWLDAGGWTATVCSLPSPGRPQRRKELMWLAQSHAQRRLDPIQGAGHLADAALAL
jgi:hypothetical protein